MTRKNIEDIYELSSTQQGMLFHTLFAPQSGVYLEQMQSTLQGSLHITAFQKAWQQVILQHPILRSSFYWEHLDKPLQAVHQDVVIPWQQLDWQSLSPEQQQDHLATFLQQDRAQGFNLKQAPLMRLTLLQLAQDHFHLVWTVHHLLFDGWSLPLLLNEVYTRYEALQQGHSLSLPAPRPYRDYIAWLQQQDLTQAEAFWRQTLNGFSVPTPLVVDHPPVPQSQGSGPTVYGEQHLVFSVATTVALQQLARQEHLTLNTIVQGIWALLLSRYSGEQDVVFGAVVSGRPSTLVGVETMVGLFINTLPVRVQIEPEVLVLSWLQQLQAQQVQARQYEYSPLVQVHGWSQVPHGQALFESLLVFENYPEVASVLQQQSGSIQVRHVRIIEQTNYPLTLAVGIYESALDLLINYECMRFEFEVIERMLGHLQTLLEAIAVHPQQRLVDLPLLTSTEREQLLFAWNNTQQEYPHQQQGLHHLFEAQAHRSPEAIALLFEDEQLTYHQLNKQANQLAHYLRQHKVGPEVLVGLCVERSLDMVIGILAVLKAGGAYVPLDPDYPTERLMFMLVDTQAQVLLTQERLRERLPRYQGQVFCLDTAWETISQEPINNLTVPFFPDQLAYVIYTSGSTGTPKGVMTSHRSITNHLLWSQEVAALTLRDRVLQTASFSFDISLWEFIGPLIAGASVILPRPGGQQDTAYLVHLLTQQSITVVHFVPSLLQMLVEEPGLASCRHLRWIHCGGERVSAELLLHLFAQVDVELYHFYGPTEASINATAWRYQLDHSLHSVHVGKPIANMQVYILDEQMQPVPIGVPGELYLGGTGLSRGYLYRPELTAERFLPHPFSEQLGAYLYKTGDLARYQHDGTLKLLGRLDQQIKIHGFRIEPGEIEAVLHQYPAVRESVVLVREDHPGKMQVVGYIVSAKGQAELNVADLRHFLQTKLPQHMVPSAFVVLADLPLTPNGKLDRLALPAPEQTRTERSSPYVAPHTPIEQTLLDIWTSVLRLQDVSLGIYDNFFEIGGDSILSMQIVSRARRVGLHLTPRQIFEHPTVAQLATVVDTAPIAQAQQSLVIGDVPLTPIEHWFFAQYLPVPGHFNQALMLEEHSPLDPLLLRQALICLVRHHDALRLRFTQQDGRWHQTLAQEEFDEDAIPFEQVDLSSVLTQEQGQFMEMRANQAQASLHLSQGPLLRVIRFVLGAQKPARLLLVIHHLAVDTVSWSILLEDMQRVYLQLQQEQPVQLPSKTTSVQHWAQHLIRYAQSTIVQQEISYWLEQIQPPIASLPVDLVSDMQDNTLASASAVSVALSTRETQELLQQVPRAYHTQINDALLTALVQGMACWTGSSQLRIHLEGHGREEIGEEVDLSRTVGWFTTLFPVLLTLHEDAAKQSPGEALKTIKEQLRRLPQHGIGYGLLRWLSNNVQIRETLQKASLPQISFNYLGQREQMFASEALWKIATESSGQISDPRQPRAYLLEVLVEVREGKLHWHWNYNEHFHRRGTIQFVAQEVLKALQALIVHCQEPGVGGYTPSDFPLARLSQKELNDFIASINPVDKKEIRGNG